MQNPEQNAIIEANGNVFVKAGAGTGKTHTMIQKLIQTLLRNRWDLHQVLAITFTEKAANEIRERILFDMQKQVENPQNRLQVRQFFHRCIQRLPFAWISTIHGFCSRVLREYPIQSGLDSSFEIISEHEQKDLIRRACLKYFSEPEGHAHLQKVTPFLKLYRYEGLIQMLQESLLRKRYEITTVINRDIKTGMADDSLQENLTQAIPGFLSAFQEILSIYMTENRSMNGIDYEDLLLMTIHLLEENDSVRNSLSERFQLIMVDEFQDTNESQKRIISLLHSPKNRVVYVGDGKQSIYRFRGADVRVFNRTMKDFSHSNIFLLQKNYRSEASLLHFINLVFSRVMGDLSPDYASVYDPLIPNLEKAADPTESPKVHLLPASSRWEEETRVLAASIVSMVQKGNVYRDMVILLRRYSSLPYLEETLTLWEIPYYIVGSRQFFQKPEIISLCSLIRVLADPLNDFEFLSLLRSYFSPFTDSEIVAIRSKDPKCFFHALIEFANENQKAKTFLGILEQLRIQYLFSSPAKLVQKCIDFFHYELTLSMMNHSRRKLLNLQKFQEFASRFSRVVSWKDFLYHIHQRTEIDEGEAVEESEQSNLVRIMTIHKSKGLEFPIVFLPELGWQKMNITNDQILVNPGKDQISFYPPMGIPVEDSFFGQMQEEERALIHEEEKRILYVAMTRAKKELVLSHSVPSKKNKGTPVFLHMLQKAKLMNTDFLWNNPPEAEYVGLVKEIPFSDLPEENPFLLQPDIEEIPIEMPATVLAVQKEPYRKYVSPSLLLRSTYHSFDQEIEEETNQPCFHERVQKKAQLGKMVHHAMQQIGHVPLNSITKEALEQHAYWEGISKADVLPAWNIIRLWANHRPLFVEELEQCLKKRNPVFSEKPIMRQLGTHVLTGIMDKLYCYDGVWKVLEFKYSQYDTQVFQERHRFQLQFYLYCLQSVFPDQPIMGTLCYLLSEKEINLFLEKDEIPGFEKKLTHLIQAFESSEAPN